MALQQFAAPVSDAVEEQHHLMHVPEKTKMGTAHAGIHSCSDWAAACDDLTGKSVTDHVLATTKLLEMPDEWMVVVPAKHSIHTCLFQGKWHVWC